MKVEAKLRKVVKGDYTVIYIDTYIDGDPTVMGERLLLSMATRELPEFDMEKDTWEEIMKMVRQGSWYKRGEAGRKALDAENAKLNNQG